MTTHVGLRRYNLIYFITEIGYRRGRALYSQASRWRYAMLLFFHSFILSYTVFFGVLPRRPSLVSWAYMMNLWG